MCQLSYPCPFLMLLAESPLQEYLILDRQQEKENHTQRQKLNLFTFNNHYPYGLPD